MLDALGCLFPDCALPPGAWTAITREDLLASVPIALDPFSSLAAWAFHNVDAIRSRSQGTQVGLQSLLVDCRCGMIAHQIELRKALLMAAARLITNASNDYIQRYGQQSVAASISARLRYFRRAVELAVLPPGLGESVMDSARRQGETGSDGYWKPLVFSTAWCSDEILLKQATPAGSYQGLAKLHNRMAERSIREGNGEERRIYGSAQNTVIIGLSVLKKRFTQRYATEARNLICGAALPRQLDEADMLNFIELVVQASGSLAAAELAVRMAAFVPARFPGSLIQRQLTKFEGKYFFPRRCPHLHSKPKDLESARYLQSDDSIAVPVPAWAAALICQAPQEVFHDCKSAAAAKHAKQIAAILKASGVSISGLTSTLMRQGPEWFGYSGLLAHILLKPSGRPPALAHYTHMGRTQLETFIQFWKLFDSNFELAERDWSFGTSYCVTEDCATGFGVAALSCESRLQGFLDSNTTNTGEIISAWNGLAGAAVFITMLLAGIRHFAFTAPTMDLLRSHDRLMLLKQKRIRAVHYPAVLCGKLARIGMLGAVVTRRLREAGIQLTSNIPPGACLFFISRRHRPHGWFLESPGPQLVARSIVACPELAEFSGIRLSWPRHLAASLLPELGFAEAEIKDFLGHREIAFDTILAYSDSPACDAALVESVADALAKRLPWFVE